MLYLITGVARPHPDADGSDQHGDAYRSLAEASELMAGDLRSARTAVGEANDGPGVSAFTTRATVLVDAFTDMAQAADRTSTAYHRAATLARQASTAMDTLNLDATLALMATARRASTAQISQLIQAVRRALLGVEGHAVTLINEAFAELNLPAQLDLTREDTYGRADPRIEAAWAELSDEERREVLQRMADDVADANGYPRITITFENIDSDPGTVTWGVYVSTPPALKLNSECLDDLHIINTVAHEMEHRGQFEGMGFRWPWQDERAGMTRAEAERWKQLNSEHVRSKGGPDFWDYYPNQPIEVDARQAGRDFVNSMSYEDFQRYL